MNMKTAFLKQLPLFMHLNESNLMAIASSMEQMVYVKNELIFHEGQKAERMFMIADGQVKIFKTGADGKEHILQIMFKHSVIAEVPMFAGDKYPASCLAMTDTILFALPRKNFIALIQQDPKIALNILALQAKRLREFTLTIERLSLQNTEQKLANYLLHNAVRDDNDNNSNQLIIPMNNKMNMQELANYLGITREHLSRTISKFKRDQIISKDIGKITLLNVAILKAMAN